MTKGVALFGATGSIGKSALMVIEAHPDQFHLEVVSAHNSVDKLISVIERFRPKHVILTDESRSNELIDQLPISFNGSLAFGEHSLVEAASGSEVDIVIAAIVGSAGLISTFAAVCSGKVVCIANKEALVMGGELIMSEAKKNGATLLPIDSEHNAIFQCLPHAYTAGQDIKGLRRLILTCSGGPFRTWSIDRMSKATPEQAVIHPNWSMGKKISVDSATLMNKGLELIEATYLFSVDESKIDVVIHPESKVHSLVEFIDGSILAQLGNPDMRIPIANVLGFPGRLAIDVQQLSLAQIGSLNFEVVNNEQFPALSLARWASRQGEDRPIILNAANEVAVNAFLSGKIGFNDITVLASECLNQIQSQSISCMDDVINADRVCRRLAVNLALEI